MNNGRYLGTILENSIRAANTGSEYVHLQVEIEGETFYVPIWLTENAMNMARASLKLCSFDVDKDDLLELIGDPHFLKGRQVPIEVFDEEYKGKLRQKARIALADVSQGRINQIQQRLRSTKGSDGAEAPSMGPAPEEDDIPF